MSTRPESEEIALYASAMGIGMADAQEMISRQRAISMPHTKPTQLRFDTVRQEPQGRKPSKLDLYAEAMGITANQAIETVRQQRETVAAAEQVCTSQ